MNALQIANTLTDLIRFRDEFVCNEPETRTINDVLECEYDCADNPVIMENIEILRKLAEIIDNA